MRMAAKNKGLGWIGPAVFLSLFWGWTFPQVEEMADSQLTLDGIFIRNEFVSRTVGSVHWASDDTGYTILEPAESYVGARDIVRYDCATGRRENVVPAGRLIPSGEKAPLRIASFEWSPDGMKILLFVPMDPPGGPRLDTGERRGLRGDYWLLDLSFWNLRKLGGDNGSKSLMAAAFSPDGRRVAYVGDHDIFVEDIYSSEIIRLTLDGSESLINGASARLYSGMNTTGLRWSPDGEKIAFLQFDTSAVREFHLINNTDFLYPRIISFPHVKPGDRLPSCRAGVVPASGGEVTWLKVPGDPENHYIHQLDWAAHPRELAVQQLNRRQNTVRVMIADAETGDVRFILVEKDESWLETNPLHWINAGKEFIWLSERDGWRHIYKMPRDGGAAARLTPGSFDVIEIKSIDEKNGWIYYLASPDDPLRRYLHRVRLDGSGKIERLTPKSETGVHDYRISPLSLWAVHTYSTLDIPPVVDLVSLPQHESKRVIEDNSAVRERLLRIARRPTEFFRVDIGGGVELDGWSILPVDFNPEKRYPVLFYVYSMPAGQSVLDAWAGNRHMWHLKMAQRGYVVMCLDSRGTPAPRGREWRKIIYKKHGLLPSDDQAAGVRAIAARWPWVDSQRIGIYGWSGGGLMSLLCIFRYPDVYQTAMAGAYLSNHRFYHAAFTERYLGLPQDNPEAYRDTSALMYADSLSGNLLLIHGTGDDNVHYQSTEALINELIEAKKMFSLMTYPNRSHEMSEGRNTQYHRYGLYTWYLDRNMPGGPR